MTVLAGVLCSDGVVVGADSSATFGNGFVHTVEQPVKKITVVGGDIIVAGTGAVGLNQRFIEVVTALHKARAHEQHKPLQFGKMVAANAIQDFASTNVDKRQYGALVAFPHGGKPYLVEFGIDDMQPEFRDANIWYGSMGSGQPIADPFLGLFRKAFCPAGPPNLATGVFITTWALSLTCELNTGGIKEPVCLTVLRKDPKSGQLRAFELSDAEVADHLANVQDAERHLSQFADKASGTDAPDIPAPPA